MFDVGFWEILLIGVVSLLVIGPEKLPEVARNVGRWVGKVQRFVAGVKSDLHRELESGELRKLIGDQEEQIRELKEMVKDTQRDVSKVAGDASELAREGLEQLRKTVDDSATPAESGDAAPATPTENNSVAANERISKS
ncbi:Sec-independent protein translocase protein TatB [Granulosicoccaceae sp. 1_MG-2023]|nr:Sec-independent protein translocase protein TatB [Granulosicoccaceae sp. 1_MG-2023]